ncbi:MAG: 2-dehydropantoate 2-reductase N-terminal domain-containing protein [Peptococcaceae bacterium]|nr:2-dehydropantoate 2-reductase N-terminal domain-containing protein [Peptococcaceae bacterium]
MKILIYGAGVIGSIFAGKLASAGCEITVLARGKRFQELQEKGVILLRPGAEKREQVFVRLTDRLDPEDLYDYILVVLQRTQVNQILPFLSENRSPNIVFVVNTAAGYVAWAEAVGKDRLMLGFPSAGGVRAGGQVTYFIGKGLMRAFQTTSFAEYGGDLTPRLKTLVQIFCRAGIPAVAVRDMDSWQKTHVAVVTGIANALYRHGGDNYALSRCRQDLALMIRGIKEGLMALSRLGIRTTPPKLNFFKLPTGLLTIVFSLLMRTRLAEITMAKHTQAAKPEMQALQRELDRLIQKSGMPTPSIDELKESLFS